MAAPPRVLVAAGLDPSGRAGLGLDLRVLQALGATALPVATCLTVQSARGLERVEPVPAELLGAMLEAAAGEAPGAVKIGALGSVEAAAVLAGLLDRLPGLPVVWDPVLRASRTAPGGPELLDAAALGRVLPLLARSQVLVAPNREELSLLAGEGPAEDPGAAARRLLEAGFGAVLLKGGHAAGARAEDLLWTAPGEPQGFAVERFPGGAVVRGTGCAWSSAAAALLAGGRSWAEACRRAQRLVAGWIRDAGRHGRERIQPAAGPGEEAPADRGGFPGGDRPDRPKMW